NDSSANFRAASRYLKSLDFVYRAKLLLPSLRLDWASMGDALTANSKATAAANFILFIQWCRFIRSCIVAFSGVFTVLLIFSFFNLVFSVFNKLIFFLTFHLRY